MKKILLVDDDPDITMIVKAKLEKTERFEVRFTNQGSGALALAKSFNPDLVLSDIDMPDKSGGEVAEELAANPETADIPVLFLSSMVRPEEIQDGMAGERPIVSKYSSPEMLIAKIDALLSKR